MLVVVVCEVDVVELVEELVLDDVEVVVVDVDEEVEDVVEVEELVEVVVVDDEVEVVVDDVEVEVEVVVELVELEVDVVELVDVVVELVELDVLVVLEVEVVVTAPSASPAATIVQSAFERVCAQLIVTVPAVAFGSLDVPLYPIDPTPLFCPLSVCPAPTVIPNIFSVPITSTTTELFIEVVTSTVAADAAPDASLFPSMGVVWSTPE